MKRNQSPPPPPPPFMTDDMMNDDEIIESHHDDITLLHVAAKMTTCDWKHTPLVQIPTRPFASRRPLLPPSLLLSLPPGIGGRRSEGEARGRRRRPIPANRARGGDETGVLLLGEAKSLSHEWKQQNVPRTFPICLPSGLSATRRGEHAAGPGLVTPATRASLLLLPLSPLPLSPSLFLFLFLLFSFSLVFLSPFYLLLLTLDFECDAEAYQPRPVTHSPEITCCRWHEEPRTGGHANGRS